MPSMANPIVVLLSLQQSLNDGMPIDPTDLDANSYLTFYDEQPSGSRFSYAKVVDRQAQALSIFGVEERVANLDCFSVGYAVAEEHRGRGLSVEAVNKGLGDLKRKFGHKMESFYLEAMIDVTNAPSLKTAEKIFSVPGVKPTDDESGTPALYFRKLIQVR
ncbi:MAG: GNAT family N-acetyltransferase [Bdellovibrionales bacterium]|nr:GNAT family N-acetyltransferase [Bdellovibrionales bacterium]